MCCVGEYEGADVFACRTDDKDTSGINTVLQLINPGISRIEQLSTPIHHKTEKERVSGDN